MTGYITKGIGGFYYVKTSEGIVECKPRGIFRKQKITPVAGDVVTLETENGGAVIADIAPRRNIFVRPPMANLDVLFLVASTTQPTPSTLVLDKLSAIAVDKGVQPVIVCTKGDLAEAEFLRSAYEKSTLPFIRIDYATGEGASAKLNTRVSVVVSAGPEPAPEPEAPSESTGSGDGWWGGLFGGGSSSSESTGDSSASSTGGGLSDWWTSWLG